MLALISKITQEHTGKARHMTKAQVSQWLSMLEHDKQKEQRLHFLSNNPEFLSEFLSEDELRHLNNRNIKRRKSTVFPVIDEVYRALKFNAYLASNRVMKLSFALSLQNSMLERVDSINLSTVNMQGAVK